MSLTHPDFTELTLPVLVSTAGLAGGGVAALAPSRTLTIGLLAGFLMPTVGTLAAFSFQHSGIMLLFCVYGIGMYVVSRISHNEYWLALNYSFLIKKHAARLEELNTLDGLTNLKNRAYFDKALER